MSWFIDNKTRKEIEDALGGPLPPPDSEEFRRLMHHLAAEDPHLRQRILEALSASPVELPSERHERRLARRALFRRLLFGWLRRETFAGDVIWDKRRILASAFGIIAMLLAGMFVVNQATSRPPVPGRSGGQETSPPAPHAAPPRTTARAIPTPGWPLLPGPVGTPASRPAAPPSPNSPVAASSAPVRSSARLQAVSPVQRVTVPAAPWPPGLTSAAASSRLVVQETTEREQPSRTLIVYDTQASVASPAVGTPPQGAIVSQGGEQPGAASTSSTPAVPAVRSGQMTAARLVTALALVPGAGAMPVVAASDGPTVTWLGEAMLGADGLVQITFHTVVGEQAGTTVRAIALDGTSRRPGLEAQVKTVARNTAAAVVGAALRSTTDYVQALLQQRQVTITNGWASITTGEAPPFWMLLGSRLAELLAPRAQEASRPIQVAEVPAGTGFTILVLQSGGR